ncbi:DUF4097 domain-containing protein [Paenibacillus oenotherae]|uniref:DUF4097 domain-containing protein n=1 Tax=Paenibacillus oenotherae TaxID=1435645 RepID=A0ABS7D8Y5_9BACL|nr:DUF4097 family beta strand repeat-containing protein [Paenibacillus oenotherae]MBW7476402.1 DUF4097 domain-containing protein [Paenibacillus oenotherae]
MRVHKQIHQKLAPLLAFLIPGAGHLVLGFHLRGLMLLAGTLTDIVAIIRFADEGGGKFALLIVYLGLALPLFWFYSVFDTLQQRAKLGESGELPEANRTRASASAMQGAAVIAVGLLLLGLVRSPNVLLPWLDAVGVYAPGVGLMFIALAIAARRGREMLKMGRFTAAIIIMTVGGLLLWDRIKGRNDIELLGQWWPAAFVLLGIEVVAFSFVIRAKNKRISFDIGGSFLAVIIAVTAFVVTQYAAMPFQWLDDLKVNLTGMSGYGEEKGFKYEKETLSVPLGTDTSKISIDNPNGKVTLRKGDVNEVMIETVLWVDVNDQQEADNVAEGSTVEVSEGDTIAIEAKGQSYSDNGSRKPRMNIRVTIPADSHFGQHVKIPDKASSAGSVETSRPLDSSKTIASNEKENLPPSDRAASGTNSGQVTQSPEGTGQDAPNESSTNNNADSAADEVPADTELSIHVSNGSVDVSGLVFTGGAAVKVTNGEITLRHLSGSVHAETKNGFIEAFDIAGSVQLDTYNGNVKAFRINGDVQGSTLSGNIEVERVKGSTAVDTKNGEIRIREADASITADTLNGSIDIQSAIVGGDWNIDSSIGEINLVIPDNGNYNVNGSVTFGSISTNLPLATSKKTIQGDIGEATYRINIDANSSITVNRYIPK